MAEISSADHEQYRLQVLRSTHDELDDLFEEATRLSLQWCLPSPTFYAVSRSTSINSRASDFTTYTDAQSVRSTATSIDSPRKSSSSSYFSRSTTSSIHDARAGDGDVRKSFRRIKDLSVLRFYKSARTNGCTHCRDTTPQRIAHELPCGHRLCAQALRGRLAVETSCCNQPIPDHLVREALTPDEYAVYSARIELCKYSMANTVEEDQITTSSKYKALRERQLEMRDNFEQWTANILQRAQDHHAEIKRALEQKHQATKDEVFARHMEALSTAEDMQVKAEADLRDLLAKEEQGYVTALKHMEAFCAGVLSNGEAHNRTVTQQDIVELQKTRGLKDNVNMKHENAINILRGEQQRRVKHRLQRHTHEIQALESQHRQEELLVEQEYRHAIAAVEAEFNKKRQSLHARWHVEMAVCLRLMKDDTQTEV